MEVPVRCRKARWLPIGLALATSLAATTAFAQATPDQGPSEAQPVPPPPPAPAAPSAAGAITGMSREEQLEARIRQLESMVNRLSDQVQNLAPASPAATGITAPGVSAERNPDTTGGGTATRGSAGPDVGSRASAFAPSRSGGAGAPGQSLPPNPPPSARFNVPSTLEDVGGNFRFGPGFELRTNDDEYILQFHNLTQFDYRGYLLGGQTNIRDTFTFPRQWWMWSGRMGKPFGYFLSIANGFDTMSLLDVFVDFELDPRLRFRVGRFKTPFTYEFFVEPIQGLLVPERSIFFNNFALNRDEGIMAFGRLPSSKVDYAAGIFNGTRNGFLAAQNNKAVCAFFVYRPFGDEEETLLENFKIGGSVFAVNQQQAPLPQTLRTVVPISGTNVAGIPFLAFNNNVRMSGPMAFWDLYTAYFYRHLGIIAEWYSGYQSYALSNNIQARTALPVQSFYVQAGYLITGETMSGIGIVKPNNPVYEKGSNRLGTGAWEPYFRVEYLDIGKEVFTNGLSDPNLWANRVFQSHVGINWHLTQYVKMYFDWAHDEFNQPVVFAPGRLTKAQNLFTWRVQLFF